MNDFITITDVSDVEYLVNINEIAFIEADSPNNAIINIKLYNGSQYTHYEHIEISDIEYKRIKPILKGKEYEYD